MSRFEILCVTMHQKDFSKIEQMNINSDVVFANQADTTSMDEMEFNGHRARMITTVRTTTISRFSTTSVTVRTGILLGARAVSRYFRLTFRRLRMRHQISIIPQDLRRFSALSTSSTDARRITW